MRAAVCVIVKNEAATLGEWLAYHAQIGFSAALVYDHRSSDDTVATARGYGALFDVRTVDWPSTAPTWQEDAYTDALRRFGNDFDWIAFIDTDEFIRLADGTTLQALLSARAEASAIALRWRMFGSSEHVERPADLVIVSYTRRAVADWWVNRHIKSLVRPAAVLQVLSPHAMNLRTTAPGVTGYVWPNGQPLVGWRGETAGIADEIDDGGAAWVNHYFIKSRADWVAKVARGYNGVRRDAAEFERYDRNEVLDEMPAALVEAVRSAMARVSAP